MMFQTSPTTAKLDMALAKAQAEIEAAAKDKVNPHFRSRYADLTAIWDACRFALGRHQLSLTQWPVHSEDGKLHLITRVAHAGEWLLCEMSIPVSKQDPQGFGSAITYAKRFALSAALGVVADEDDDGNKASEPTKARPAAPSTVFKDPGPGKVVITGHYTESQPAAPAPSIPVTMKDPGALRVEPGTANKAGEAERQHVKALADKHAWSNSEVSRLIQERFRVKAVTDLTLPQSQELCALIATERPGDFESYKLT